MKNNLGFQVGLLIIIFCSWSLGVSYAQDLGIHYQGVLRDENGTLLQNQSATIEFQIIRGQPNGPVAFTESVETETDDFGLVNLIIGRQNANAFNQINWGADIYFLKVLLNGVQIGATRQFQAVPYSKIATDMGLDQLVDVSASAAAEGQFLQFRSGIWEPGDIETREFTAGNGIAINGNEISNTAPDQTVTLNAGNNITVNGSYPTFEISAADGGITYTAGDGIAINNNEISNTAPDRTVTLREGNNVDISGTYPDFTIAATGGITYQAGNGISINDNTITNIAPDQTVTLTEGNNIDITGTYPNFTIAATGGGGGSSVWSTSGNNIFYNGGSITMGKNSPVNGLNVNNIQYLPTGRLLDVNLPVNIRGNVFITHDFGNGNFGLSLRNNQIPNRIWTMHIAANDPISPADGSLNLLYNGDGKVRFSTDGSLQIDGTLTQGSDMRFKSDIQPVDEILTRALQLKLTSYRLKRSNGQQLGYVAQEVQKIFPELVFYHPDNDRYYLNYQSFGPIAIEALKEQQTVIDEQAQRIDQLEARIERLEEMISRN